MMFRVFLFVLFVCFTLSARATLIDNGDWTSDSQTGLDWLDVEYTEGLTYNQVLEQVDTGSLNGWRYATSLELEQMVTNHLGFAPIEDNVSVQYDGMVSLVSLFGPTYGIGDDKPNVDYSYTVGYVDSEGLSYANARQFGYSFSGGNTLGYFRPDSSTIWDTDKDETNDRRSSFLVRSTVPLSEPMSLMVFILWGVAYSIRTRHIGPLRRNM